MEEETRNLIDHYHYWKEDAINAELDTKRCDNYSILCGNLYNDFNISCVIRSSNAFLAKEVIVYGRKKYDKRGTVGAHHYSRFRYVREEDRKEALVALRDEFDVIVGVDNIDGSSDVNDFEWPFDKKVLICFGQEQVGLYPEILDICDHLVYIKQYGSVRSLNVAAAASIVMYDYMTKKTNHSR